jgi:hypothetical protein
MENGRGLFHLRQSAILLISPRLIALISGTHLTAIVARPYT